MADHANESGRSTEYNRFFHRVETAIISPPFEDSYALSPMQQGMLFDSLQADAPDVYCMVVAYSLEGPLDTGAFTRAWQHVVDRHPILRTSFDWSEATQPRQRVHRTVELSLVTDDWRDGSPEEQHARLTAFLHAESRRGFNLRAAPLMRAALFRCGDRRYQFVLAQHHLLMDGSCKQLLFDEAFSTYAALCRGELPDLPPPTPYKDYLAWLGEQDMSAAEAFWRAELRGFTEPTMLPSRQQGSAHQDSYEEFEVRLDEAATEQLKASARRHRLTLNSIVSGVWALVLARASRASDVVFGMTINARPASLHTEAIVGLFINTLPVRAAVTTELPLPGWLRGIQASIAGLRDFDFAPLWRIQRWCAVPPGRALFESIVVFENNPGYGAGAEQIGEIAITSVRPFTRNSLPLTIRVVPGPSLAIQWLYDGRRFAAGEIQLAGEQMVALLRDVSSDAERPLRHFLARIDDIDRDHHARAAAAFQSAMGNKLRQASREGRRPAKP